MPLTKLDRKDQGLDTVDEDLLTPSLVRVDLSKNRIHNPLPGVAHLVELRWLNLSKNKLTVCIDWSGGMNDTRNSPHAPSLSLSLSLFRSQTLPFNEISLSLSFSRAWPKHARFFLFLSRVRVCTSHARAIGRIS